MQTTVSAVTARMCQQVFDNIRPFFVNAAQRKKAFDALLDCNLDILRSLERELDLI